MATNATPRVRIVRGMIPFHVQSGDNISPQYFTGD